VGLFAFAVSSFVFPVRVPEMASWWMH